MAQKIEIPGDLTQQYEAPAGASISDLQEIAKDAQTRALAILDKDNYTDEEYAQAQWLAGAVDVANTGLVGLEEQAAEKQRLRDELRGKLGGTDPETDPEGDEGGDQSPATPAPTPEPAGAVVAAAGRPVTPTLAAIAREAGQPIVVTARPNAIVSLVAAADVQGYSNGQVIGVDDLGIAFETRARAFNANSGPGIVQSGFAQVKFDVDDSLVASAGKNGTADVTALLKHAADESRLEGGSLVAAGGWCAPSEVLYDLLDTMTSEGLISVPEITVRRGGVKWATGPNFGAVYGTAAFWDYTEAQIQGGQSKTVLNIPCPSPTEARMGVTGLYLTGDILTQQGWPEAVSDYITKALTVFDHFISAKTINDMVAGSTALNLSSASAPMVNQGAIANILGAVGLVTEDMKYRGRLSRGQSVEVVLPFYARSIMRADLFKRQSLSLEEIKVADAEIDDLFRTQGVSPQYVYDWQENISSGGSANPFGGASGSGATTWPQTLKFLIYPAGSWARALAPVIDLSTVYDSTLLTTNQYVALFAERGRLTINRGFDSRVVTVNSNPSGLTSGAVAVTSPAPATPL